MSANAEHCKVHPYIWNRKIFMTSSWCNFLIITHCPLPERNSRTGKRSLLIQQWLFFPSVPGNIARDLSIETNLWGLCDDWGHIPGTDRKKYIKIYKNISKNNKTTMHQKTTIHKFSLYRQCLLRRKNIMKKRDSLLWKWPELNHFDTKYIFTTLSYAKGIVKKESQTAYHFIKNM